VLSISAVNLAPAMSSGLPMSAAASDYDDALVAVLGKLDLPQGEPLHDARGKLRADLAKRGFTLQSI
jgi:hypothetical protein